MFGGALSGFRSVSDLKIDIGWALHGDALLNEEKEPILTGGNVIWRSCNDT